jgi:hypothetical protein
VDKPVMHCPPALNWGGTCYYIMLSAACSEK